MQLTFEYSQKVADGASPAGFHSPDNVVQVFFTDGDGRIRGIIADTPEGAFDSRNFYGEAIAASDTNVQFLKVAYLPRMNLWAVWESHGKHRMAVFILKQEIDKYLVRGDIVFRNDRPIATLKLVLENPEGIIAMEDATDAANIPPGARVNVFFSSGNSTRFHLGIFYIDRIKKSVGQPEVHFEARNASGKLLRDQSFDENNTFAVATIDNIIKDILDDAGVVSYYVQSTAATAGMKFPPDMSYYDGIRELFKIKSGWIMKEKETGFIIIGDPAFHQFSSAGTYNFMRGKDCFRREIVRDDREVYARVCVHTRDYDVAAYQDVDFMEGWNLAAKKTLYVEAPDDISQGEAEAHAQEVASRLAGVGIIETLVGPFRPHIQPGDGAEIAEPGRPARLIGVITQVEHRFGREGFFTEFSVDSGGRLKKPTISELVELISARRMRGAIKLS